MGVELAAASPGRVRVPGPQPDHLVATKAGEPAQTQPTVNVQARVGDSSNGAAGTLRLSRLWTYFDAEEVTGSSPVAPTGSRARPPTFVA